MLPRQMRNLTGLPQTASTALLVAERTRDLARCARDAGLGFRRSSHRIAVGTVLLRRGCNKYGFIDAARKVVSAKL